MRIGPSRYTVYLLYAAALVFAFNCALEIRYRSSGRAGFYAVMAILWALLGWLVSVRRTSR